MVTFIFTFSPWFNIKVGPRMFPLTPMVAVLSPAKNSCVPVCKVKFISVLVIVPGIINWFWANTNVDKVNRILGMDVTMVTTAKTDNEAFELLSGFGLPFKKKQD